MKKSNACNNDCVLTDLMEDKLVDSNQVGYKVTEEGVKTPLINLLGERIAGIIHKK